MSIDDVKIIDVIGIKDEQVLLTIVDDWEWNGEDLHLIKLQDKINAYLGTIETGELVEIYPDAKDKKICINVMYKFTPDKTGNIFLNQVKQIKV